MHLSKLYILFIITKAQCFYLVLRNNKRSFNYYKTVLYLNIDPLDQIKTSTFPSNNTNNSEQGKYNINNSLKSDNLIKTKTLDRNKVKYKRSKEDISSAIEQYEAKLLDTLPINLFNYFISVCEKYTIRVSLVAFTIHIMMLIPTLRFIKIDLGMSIIPYIYLGPIVALIPVIVYWLWLNNAFELELFDDLFYKYIKLQQDSAILKLANEEESMIQILQSQDDQDTLKLLATCKLFTKINLKAIKDEVYAFKSKGNKFKRNKSDIFDNNENFKGQLNNDNSINNAVQLLLESALESGETNDEVLKKLKKLQEDFKDIS